MAAALAGLWVAATPTTATIGAGRSFEFGLAPPTAGVSPNPASAANPSPEFSAAVDGKWSDLAPPQRVNHAAIYDSLRDRMLVFGGHVSFSASPYASNETWSFALGGTEVWSHVPTSGDIPIPAANHVAICDPVRDRMLVVVGGGRFGVWALDLADLVWTRLSISGTPPAPYVGTSTVYDARRDRLLVFGGVAYGLRHDELYNQVWSLDLSATQTWTELAPIGGPPTPRYRHAAVYDRANDRMVVFGGAGEYEVLNNEVWGLDLSGDPEWVLIAPSGTAPGPRAGSLSVYDAATSRMLVFGGSSPGNDVWSLSLAGAPEWSPLTPQGTPPSARVGPSLVLDGPRHRLLLYGGSYDGRGGETWSLTLGGAPRWDLVSGAPPGRNGHSAVYDPGSDRMIVFGGFAHGRPPRNDLWAKDLGRGGTWTQLLPTGPRPTPRYGHSAIADPKRRRMIVFGGYGVTDSYETWELSLDGQPTWSQLFPGVPPYPREFASVIHDTARDRMVIFGGTSSGLTAAVFWNDVWALSLGDVPAWRRLIPGGEPPSPRSNASAIYDAPRDRMLVFGGLAPTGFPDTVWALSFDPNPAWSVVSANGSPGGRAYPSAIYDPVLDRMVVFESREVWALSLSGAPQWTQLQPSGSGPYYRCKQSVIYEPPRNRMVLFAGFSPGQGIDTFDYNDTWALTWEQIPTAVLVSLESAMATSDAVRLSWFTDHGPGIEGTVYRHGDGEGWRAIAAVSSDATGRLVHEDRDATPGRRYGYRLGVREGRHETFWGDTWIEVPLAWRLSLAGLRPNPSARRPVVAFALPNATPARLDVFDVSSRRVFSREVGTLGPGNHVVDLGEGQALPAGVYLLRLTQGERSATARGVVLQ